jgi:hypothetical protein
MEEQMSKAAVIRYRTKPEAADENQRLIEKVFAELATTEPAGLTYTSVRLADGVSFVHVVTGQNDGLVQLAAFQEFQRNLSDRLETAPERDDGTPIGSYGG